MIVEKLECYADFNVIVSPPLVAGLGANPIYGWIIIKKEKKMRKGEGAMVKGLVSGFHYVLETIILQLPGN